MCHVLSYKSVLSPMSIAKKENQEIRSPPQCRHHHRFPTIRRSGTGTQLTYSSLPFLLPLCFLVGWWYTACTDSWVTLRLQSVRFIPSATTFSTTPCLTSRLLSQVQVLGLPEHQPITLGSTAVIMSEAMQGSPVFMSGMRSVRAERTTTSCGECRRRKQKVCCVVAGLAAVSDIINKLVLA